MADPFDDPRFRDLSANPGVGPRRGRPRVHFESVADLIYLVMETDEGPAMYSVNHREALALAIDLIYASKAVAVFEDRAYNKRPDGPREPWDPMSVKDRGTTAL